MAAGMNDSELMDWRDVGMSVTDSVTNHDTGCTAARQMGKMGNGRGTSPPVFPTLTLRKTQPYKRAGTMRYVPALIVILFEMLILQEVYRSS